MHQHYRDLPHIQPVEAVFFVTARLHGSVPMAVLEQLREESERERKRLLASDKEPINAVNQHKREFARFDAQLDSPQNGPYWLGEQPIAEILIEAVHFRHNKEYDLVAFCIMSNHYHLVIDTRRLGKINSPLHRIVQSMHANVARKCNTILVRTGTFWHDEYYDHIIRDDAELRRVIEYTLTNPVKAGLVEKWQQWPYSYVNEAYW